MNTRVVRRLGLLGAALAAVGGLVIVVAVPWVGGSTGSRAAAAGTKFCGLVADITPAVPATTAMADPATAAHTAKQLDAAAAHAPWAIRKSMRRMATLLGDLSAHHDPTRIATESPRGSTYTSDFAVFSSYRSKYCPATLPVSPALPGVQAARDAACVADGQTIQLAENLYSDVNGSFAPMGVLVSSGFLRSMSSFYSGVTLDAPAGGYTLRARPNGPCASLPVAG